MSEQQYLTKENLRGKFFYDEPMSKHTSWRTGGVARRAYLPANVEDLALFLKTVPEKEPIYFVGLGSNLLVRDGGFNGTVVLTHSALAQLKLVSSSLFLVSSLEISERCSQLETRNQKPEALVYAEAGVPSPKVARFAAMHGFKGAEFLAGIPGTVGGALAMNAGCYGGETWNYVARVLIVSRQGELMERTPGDYEVGYRTVSLRETEVSSSSFLVSGSEISAQSAQLETRNQKPETEFFLAAWFNFPQGNSSQSKEKIKKLLEKRINAQPLDLPNAGSVFRNPEGDYAARLIEVCGLKGLRIGGAEVSTKHANFIVNEQGKATARDIETLIATMRATVKQMQGVELEQEVRVIGETA